MDEKTLDSRAVLLKAALKDFSKQSYEQTSLNHIIKSSGVSKGSFYHHFKNKEDLYLEVLKEGVHQKWQFISEYAEDNDISFETLDVFEKILQQARIGLRFAEEYPLYAALANQFVKEKGQPIYENALAALNLSPDSSIKAMVKSAYESGELDPSYDLDFLEIIIEKMMLSYDDFFTSANSTERNFQYLDQYVRFMARGLGKK